MVNSVPELSQRLVKALDEDYNVIDMRAVLEIISLLEQTSVTEELLKTTRLGKLVNVLRKKTSNEELANRAKGLVKKWRKIALPLSNGSASAEHQQRTASSVVRNTNNNVHQYSQHNEAVAFRNGTVERIVHRPDSRSQSPLIKNECPPPTIYVSDRSQSPMLVQTAPVKRRLGTDIISQQNKCSDISEVLDNQNSNSSFHSVISIDTSDADKSLAAVTTKHKKERRSSKKHKNVASDFDSLSNTSESIAVYFQHGTLQNALPPKKSDLTFEGKLNNIKSHEKSLSTTLPLNEIPAIQPPVEEKPTPKKRGRKKGSKLIGKPVVNSYSDIKQKIASISGKTKIKTTKELLADLQNRKNQGLSQSVTTSLVLSPTTPLVKVEPPKPATIVPNILPQPIKKEPVLELENVKIDETPSTSISAPTVSFSKKRARSKTPEPQAEGPLTIQQILAQLPPIDKSFQWSEDPNEVLCTCTERPASPIPTINVIAPAPKRSIFDEDYEEEPPEHQGQLVAVPIPPPSLPKTIIDPECPAKAKYCDEPQNITSDMLDRLHNSFIDGVNGNRDHGSISINENLNLDRTDCVPKYGITPEGSLHLPLPKNPGSDSDCVLVHSNIQFSERNSENSSYCSRNEFKEWHEVVQRRSYHDELITILPYVIID